MSKFKLYKDDLDSKLDRISRFEDIEKIEKRVLKKGLNEIRKEAKSLLRKLLPNSRKRNPMYDDTLESGVMQSVVTDGHDTIGKVHVMGTRRKTSGTYRLRFFEGGTKERIKKSTGAKTGHIKALNFFESATNAKETDALIKIEEEWDKEILKLLE